MDERLQRTRGLLGDQAMANLENARVAVFGIGGVGGFVVEALARAGVGQIDLIDYDKVEESNINRQIIATGDTIGRYKTEVMKQRILSINPQAIVREHKCFFLKERAHEFNFSEYSYVVDAIDTISGKLELIVKAKEAKVPVISAMGAGNKLDPTMFEVADIYKTVNCRLAKVMRKELRARGVDSLKVVYSQEKPTRPLDQIGSTERGLSPGSVSFVPSVMGLIIGGEVIKDIGGINK